MPISPHLAELRKHVGSSLLVVPSVAVVVRDPDGRVLLVRDRVSGSWGLPAGAVELGEAPLSAARRELREETGIDAEDLTLVGAVGGADFRHRYPNGDQVEYQVFVYSTEAEAEGLPVDRAEIVEVSWFGPEEMPELTLPYPDSVFRPDR